MRRILLVCSLLWSFNVLSSVIQDKLFVGLGAGYGSSDWSYLCSAVPEVQLASPSKAVDQGVSANLFAQYIFSPYSSLRVNYESLPDAKITFEAHNIYPQFHFKKTTITSSTQVLGVAYEFMLPVYRQRYYAFSDLGIAATHRQDVLATRWHWGPLFGGGLGWHQRNFLAELGFQYSAGSAKATMQPADDYIPFTYDVFVQMGVKV